MRESTGRCDDESVRIGRRGRGFVAEAARFYLWDEDPGEVVRTACRFAALVGAGPVALQADARDGTAPTAKRVPS